MPRPYKWQSGGQPPMRIWRELVAGVLQGLLLEASLGCGGAGGTGWKVDKVFEEWGGIG